MVQITSEASSPRSKHIDVKFKFLKDVLLIRTYERIMSMHVPTKLMLADFMINAFPSPTFRRQCRMIGLIADSQ